MARKLRCIVTLALLTSTTSLMTPAVRAGERQVATASSTATRHPTQTPRPPLEACVGDCDGSGTITVDELVRGVGIALDRVLLSECPTFDRDGNGAVGITELLQAVGGTLYGCLSGAPAVDV